MYTKRTEQIDEHSNKVTSLKLGVKPSSAVEVLKAGVYDLADRPARIAHQTGNVTNCYAGSPD